jgi:hypothetical protein
MRTWALGTLVLLLLAGCSSIRPDVELEVAQPTLASEGCGRSGEPGSFVVGSVSVENHKRTDVEPRPGANLTLYGHFKNGAIAASCLPAAQRLESRATTIMQFAIPVPQGALLLGSPLQSVSLAEVAPSGSHTEIARGTAPPDQP